MNAFYSALRTSSKFVLGAGILGGAGALGVASLRTVPSSTVSYRNMFGHISEEPLAPGIHFVNPLAELINMPLYKNKYHDKISVASNEGLSVKVGVNVNYRLTQESAREIYMHYRDNYEDILIRPLIKSALREIMTGYEAKDLYTSEARDQIWGKLKSKIIEKLEAEGIVTDELFINDIELPEQLKLSIEAKLKAEQDNEKVNFTLEKERKENKFKLEMERVEAERKKIEAEGIKTFQDIVSQGLTQELIQWKGINATEKIAKSNNSKVVVIGNKSTNGLPIILGNGA